MKPHRFDALSFTFGLTFAIVAVLLSVPRLNFDAFGLRWVGAGFLLLLGLLLILTSRSRGRDA
ncbi:MAG TPA: hypothetical protein VFA34_11540 [Actinomycetota bacterium]|jgi:hypothetical protein|nr:hypothetical protein [Actinomycetota bacterium]